MIRERGLGRGDLKKEGGGGVLGKAYRSMAFISMHIIWRVTAVISNGVDL